MFVLPSIIQTHSVDDSFDVRLNDNEIDGSSSPFLQERQRVIT